MCTLSFQPTATGFYLLMNRDEQLSRPQARAPDIFSSGSGWALYPSEPGGGTWIGVNEFGFAWALVNWYEKTSHHSLPGKKSRGLIIPSLLSCATWLDVEKKIEALAWTDFPPFRLVGLTVTGPKLQEWRWDGEHPSTFSHPWQRTHWFSSGYAEAEAVRVRSAVVAHGAAEPSAGSLTRLQKLHQSHQPERGPFSICMHRSEAQTVSSTEILAERDHAQVRYHAGPPCTGQTWVTRQLDFKSRNHL